MPGMDSALADELRALRARAYGRDADLDPAAAARLRELETMRVRARADAARAVPDLRRSTDPEPQDTADPDARDRAAVLDALESLDPGVSLATRDVERRADGGEADAGDGKPEADGGSATQDPDAVRADSRIRRGRVALWIASLVATAAVASAVTWGVAEITPVATSSGAPQVATLKPVAESGVVGSMFAADGDSPMFEFFGLSLFRGAGAGWSGSSGEAGTCLHVLATEHVPDVSEIESGSWGVDGPIYTGCGAGAFPPAVTIAIDASSPEQLRDEFPDATAIQFVLDGDRVGVFLDAG